MHFSTFFTLAAAAFSCVAAAPSRFDHQKTTALTERATTADFVSFFNNLGSTLAPYESSLQSDFNGVSDKTDGAAIVAAVSGDFANIDAALVTAGTNIKNLRKRELIERQGAINTTAVADAVAALITDLLNALSALESLAESDPTIGALLAPFFNSLDADLAVILTGLGLVLAGVLALVSDLLSDLGSALSGLGGASAGVLGL